MTLIRPPDEGSGKKSPISKDQHAESKDAEHLASKGGQIKETPPKRRFSNPFKWIASKFTASADQKNVVSEVRKKFLKNAFQTQSIQILKYRHRLNQKEVDYFFSTFLNPVLEKTADRKNVELFLEFLDIHPFAIDLFFLQTQIGKPLAETKQQISLATKLVFDAMNNNTDVVIKNVIERYESLSKLMKTNITNEKYLDILTEIIQYAAFLKSENEEDQQVLLETIDRTISDFISQNKIQEPAKQKDTFATTFLEKSKLTEKYNFILEHDPIRKNRLQAAIAEASSRGNLDKLEEAFALAPRVATVIDSKNRLHEFNFVFQLAEFSSQLDQKGFSELVSTFSSLLEKIEELQLQKPKVFGSESKEVIELMSLKEKIEGFGITKPLMPYIEALIGLSTLSNTQIFSQAVGAFASPTVMQSRFPGADFAIHEQVNIPFLLPANEEQLLDDFHYPTEILLTHPFTMETRAVRVPLPITERGSVKEIKNQLQLLSMYLSGKEKFEDLARDLELEPKAFEEKFSKFKETLEQKFCTAQGDFNKTEKRVRFAGALEETEMVQALNDPASVEKAKKAAALQNIFLTEKDKLSLLPSKLANQQPEIATLSPEELEGAIKLLKGEGEETKIKLSKGQEGTMKLNVRSEVVGLTPFLAVESTIDLNGKTSTRKAYYSQEVFIEGERRLLDPNSLKKQVVDSKLFERDLLLAKATFLEKNP